ncbi:MAG: efflux transporter periplasmic adaptor subunit [Clostridiales bacterium]|jgi:RND family efflux transporter MFP subunit|nr:efflux transporter periplasmic adaptor subunit [Clostridiales bacterium]
MFKNRSFTVCIFLIIITLILIPGCGKKDPVQSNVEQKISVKVADVGKQNIVYKTKITGNVKAEKDVSIIPKVGGRVEEVNIEVGQRVEKGDTLIVLERDEIAAALKQAEAALASSKALRVQNESTYNNAKIDYERMKKLYSEGAISKQLLDQARLQLDVSNPDSIEAQVKQAEAALEQAKYNLANTIITSPISGIVTSVDLEEGEMASPGIAVARVVNMDKVYIESSVTENQVNHLEVGQKVDVIIGAISTEPLVGTVYSVSPAADESKSYPVKVELENSGYTIKPGMFAEVEIILAEKNNVISVPLGVIVERNGEEGVFVVEGNNAVFKKIVRGLDDGENVEVLSGLKEGEKLVVMGHHSLTNNTPVKVIGRGEK